MIDLPESSRHPLLRRFLDDLSELLPHVWDILQSHPDLNPDVRTAMSDLPGPLRERLVQLVAALESGNYDSILEEHGLTEGPELAFKLAGYNGSRSEISGLACSTS